jgi:hypothetical protein
LKVEKQASGASVHLVSTADIETPSCTLQLSVDLDFSNHIPNSLLPNL